MEWDQVARSFNKLLGSTSDTSEDPASLTEQNDSTDIMDVGAHLSLSANEVQEWLSMDRNLSEELTDEEIVQLASDAADHDSGASDSEDEESLPSQPVISHKAAVDAFSLCITYLEQQEETQGVQLMLLNQLLAMAQRKNSAKQTHITDFFQKN